MNQKSGEGIGKKRKIMGDENNSGTKVKLGEIGMNLNKL